MSPEDEKMFLSQYVCARCHHRFTTQEDAQMHFTLMHDKQPTPADLMMVLQEILVAVKADPAQSI